MAEFHDELATRFGDEILNKIRTGDKQFKQVFTNSLYRIGDWDWPRPDYVCYDEDLKASYALEFKPPFQSKREYLTGLGQALSYLRKHNYSGLILPTQADDGFQIAQFVSDTLKLKEFESIPISLYVYDEDNYNLELKNPIIVNRIFDSGKYFSPEVKTFWCWWRDLSQYELFELLNLSFIYSEFPGDIYSQHIYNIFYKMMVEGKTKQWDGSPRNKKYSDRSKKSEKQNYNIPLVQLNLWTRGTGRLTDIGYELLRIGKKYGPDSEIFKYKLAYLILTYGKHLDLIRMVDQFQKENRIPNKSKEYAKLLDEYLTKNGCIGKRKPSAITTDAKGSYLRDEMKLWNKLGFLKKHNKTDYFIPNKGYEFNYDYIMKTLIEGNKTI